MYQFSETRQPEVDERSMANNLVSYTNRSFYLTGKPGTGKTSLLRQAAEQSGKKFIFLSTAREAAISEGVVNIHSFFQLPHEPFIWESFTDAQKHIFNNYSNGKKRMIEEAELFIIDDIASVRADAIDGIDFRLRHSGGKKNLPFGGKQVVFAGDVFQLTNLASNEQWELLKENYDTPYFFSARALLKADLLTIELKHLLVEEDEQFGSLLNKIRRKQTQQQDIEQINTRYVPDFSPLEQDNFIQITTHQSAANEINIQRLNELPGTLYSYKAVLEGCIEDNLAGGQLLVETELLLKENAQVIFINDDAEGRWKKGTVAKVTLLAPEGFSVAIHTADSVNYQQPEQITWQNLQHECVELPGIAGVTAAGTFTQFPVRLGWALSPDSFSGFRFDKVMIDVCGADTGSAYTALSRCKTLEGIQLMNPVNHVSILVRDEVVRLSLSANNEKVIKDAITNGRADMLYRQCVQAFDQGDFEQAIADLTRAIALRNDTDIPSFKRLMASKLNKLKNKQHQKFMPVQKFIWAEEKKERANSAEVHIAEPAEILDAAELMLKQPDTGRHAVEQSVEELAGNGVELETANQNLLITRMNFEEVLPAFHSNGHGDSTTIKQLESQINSINEELLLQKEETARFKESLKLLTDGENNRNFESKRAVKYWSELNSQITSLEADIAKWKNIIVIGGIVFCLIITVLLFVVFRI